MSCGVLVVSPAPPPPASPPARAPDGGPGVGHELAETLRAAGHSVVECDAPADLCTARGVVEAAWVVLAGLDLLVLVEDGTLIQDGEMVQDGASGQDGAMLQGGGSTPGAPPVTLLLSERARELMTDRGPGGAIAHVPPGVSATTAAACLLELLDSSSTADTSALRVEPVPPRDESRHGGEHDVPAPAVGGSALARGRLAGGPFGGPS